jgi:hypothetical protein
MYALGADLSSYPPSVVAIGIRLVEPAFNVLYQVLTEGLQYSLSLLCNNTDRAPIPTSGALRGQGFARHQRQTHQLSRRSTQLDGHWLLLKRQHSLTQSPRTHRPASKIRAF